VPETDSDGRGEEGGVSDPERVPLWRLRLTPASLVRAVLLFLLVLAGARLFLAATRPLGWLAVALTVAAILQPIVARLARHIPRGLSIVVVALASLGLVGGLVYSAIDDVRDQVANIEEDAPEAARDLERSERFGEFAREANLEEKVDSFVDELPERLQGGDAVEAARSAATRGVAFLATFVLMLFLLISGPRSVEAALDQIHDDVRRARVASVLEGAYRNWWRYLALTLGRATLAGVFTYVVCLIADVPAAVLLALWVGAWSIVPLVGVFVGSIAVVLLAVPTSLDQAGSLLIVFLGYQVAEVFLIQRRIEARSIHVGPFLTLLAAMLGLEIYGFGGLVLTVLVMVFAVCVADQLAPHDDSDLVSSAEALVTGEPPEDDSTS
jgi:predicted PurR-regulated permease PerM